MSNPSSGPGTPRTFTSQAASAEDLLKSQTVGLVNLEDFRKRRADVLEQKIKEAQNAISGKSSGTATPVGSDGVTPSTVESSSQPPRKKKKKSTVKIGLSFGDDEGEGEEGTFATRGSTSKTVTPRNSAAASPQPEELRDGTASPGPRRLTPNPNTLLPAPKLITKASLKAEALQREALRREFLAMQEAVKNTEITVPFVFYDGTNIPGGKVKIKKGDRIWLFLERARKVGADTGAAGSGGGTTAGTGGGGSRTIKENRKAWSRVSVDDLICVRGEVIVPNHYELYYFIANRITHPGRPALLFDYSNTAPTDDGQRLLRTAGDTDKLEGDDADPTVMKVVDRRWYERNKHIFPASMWKEYKAGDDVDENEARIRRDAGGNALFFS